MTRVLGIGTAGALLTAGFLSAAACGGQMSSGGVSSVRVSTGAITPGLVRGLVLSCDRREWRVRFTLNRRAAVSGGLDRRSPARWRLIEPVPKRTFPAGPHVVRGQVRGAGLARVRLRFTASGGKTERRIVVFRPGCNRPPPPVTTPTLPGSTGTVPLQ